MAARINLLAKPLAEQAMKEPPQVFVPAAALVERNGRKHVFVFEKGTVRLTPITVGRALPGGFVVHQGPAVGTQLVQDPPKSMNDGDAVKERSSP
jgi:hypothetical protein